MPSLTVRYYDIKSTIFIESGLCYIDLLNESCKKLNLKSAVNYKLVCNNKDVDLTQVISSYASTNIFDIISTSNNNTIHLCLLYDQIKYETDVSIQTILIDIINSFITHYDIPVHCSKQPKLMFIKKVYQGNQLNMTFSQLGFTKGSIAFRLLFEDIDQNIIPLSKITSSTQRSMNVSQNIKSLQINNIPTVSSSNVSTKQVKQENHNQIQTINSTFTGVSPVNAIKGFTSISEYYNIIRQYLYEYCQTNLLLDFNTHEENSALNVSSSVSNESMNTSLVSQYQEGINTLSKILINIKNSPFDLKKRDINATSAAITSKIDSLSCITAVFHIIGFNLTNSEKGKRYIFTYPGTYIQTTVTEQSYLDELLSILSCALNTPKLLFKSSAMNNTSALSNTSSSLANTSSSLSNHTSSLSNTSSSLSNTSSSLSNHASSLSNHASSLANTSSSLSNHASSSLSNHTSSSLSNTSSLFSSSNKIKNSNETTQLPADFDPYKPIFSHQYSSNTSKIDKRYDNMIKQQQSYESVIPQRDVCVFLCPPGYVTQELISKYNQLIDTKDLQNTTIQPILKNENNNKDLFDDNSDDDNEKDDLKILKHVLNVQNQNKDQPLETKAYREIKNLKSMTLYSYTVLRFQFPDNIIVFIKFAPMETIERVKNVLYSIFKPYCAVYQFDLYTTPPKIILPTNKSLRSLKLVPSGIVYVSWSTSFASDSPGSYIKPEYTINQSNIISIPSGKKIIDEFDDTRKGKKKQSFLAKLFGK